MSKHNVTVLGSGAMCQDCGWIYSPGCGHNAERNAYFAAFKHEEETAAADSEIGVSWWERWRR